LDSEKVVGAFAQQYIEDHRSWQLRWFGRPCWQNPMDMWAIQEIIWDTKPQVLVETGTHTGGSAHLWAWLLAAASGEQVVTVDIDQWHDGSDGVLPISYLTGSSIDPAIAERVHQLVDGRRAMVLLDSAHSVDHVAAELRTYAPLVAVGCYMVVQDTFIGGHPVNIHHLDPQHGPEGPWPAVQEFVASTSEFEVDKAREPSFTFCTDGYLLRVT
jgi:cephalosporin hydroxylase